jgi:hypothetical protein
LLLYLGLGTAATGLIFFCIGTTGERGFSSSSLRLLGPVLIAAGCLLLLLWLLTLLLTPLCHSLGPRLRALVGGKNKDDLASGDSSQR